MRSGDDPAPRLRALRRFAEGVRILPILTQTEPDPDAIGSAFAVRVLLGRNEKTAPIVSLGQSRRPETRRMIELLDLHVTEVTEAELKSFERVVAVDLQPIVLRGTATRVAVIDHHPPESGFHADFSDVRPEIGAVATILTEYLLADGQEIGARLATALLFGIRTDTAMLTRGSTRDDVEAYAYLQERADHSLLSTIDRPAYPRDALPQVGRALERAQLRDDLAVLWLGRVRRSRAHLMPELADLSLNIEGVRWVAAGGVVERALVVNIRYLSENEPGAGTLARQAAKRGGSGGGHATMARVEIPLENLPFSLDDEPDDDPSHSAASANAARLADWIEGELEKMRR
ncbi:MAG TPA: hypothetical protein VMN78_13930 [Longimicrobiales bacterium]|nr:hypothetical protein [Longimicrobiales bacterium]